MGTYRRSREEDKALVTSIVNSIDEEGFMDIVKEFGVHCQEYQGMSKEDADRAMNTIGTLRRNKGSA